MTTLINRTHSPFSITSKNGPVFLPAFGQVEGDFDDEYLKLLETCKAVEVVRTTEPDARQKYKFLTGKNAPKTWDDARILAEIDKLREA